MGTVGGGPPVCGSKRSPWCCAACLKDWPYNPDTRLDAALAELERQHGPLTADTLRPYTREAGATERLQDAAAFWVVWFTQEALVGLLELALSSGAITLHGQGTRSVEIQVKPRPAMEEDYYADPRNSYRITVRATRGLRDFTQAAEDFAQHFRAYWHKALTDTDAQHKMDPVTEQFLGDVRLTHAMHGNERHVDGLEVNGSRSKVTQSEQLPHMLLKNISGCITVAGVKSRLQRFGVNIRLR